MLHDAELTYSVSAPAGLPGFGAGLDEACGRIAAGLVAGLRLLGLDAAVPARGRRATPGIRRHPGCFATAVRHEIEIGGRKLVGSAQRRLSGGFLQHGSILIESHGPLLGEVLRRGSAQGGRTRMIGLAELLSPCPQPAAVAGALAAGCAAAWGCSLGAGAPGPGELREARALETGRYRSEDWTSGRLRVPEAG